MDRKDIEGILPLSPGQRALYVSRVSVADDTGLQQVRAILRGPLDRSTLEEAWRAVVQRHPALRMTCNPRDKQDPLLVVWRQVEAPVTWLDWTPSAPHEALAAFLDSDRRQGLDLTQKPPMRLTVAALGPTTHQLVWTCHHLFLDGWSSGIVLGDLMAALNGTPPTGSAAAFRSFKAQHGLRTRAPTPAELQYWTAQLAGFEGLPPLRTLPTIGPANHAVRSCSFAPATTQHLLAVANRAGVTPSTVCQAAWALVLSRFTGSDDVVLGTVMGGRSADLPGVMEVAGFLSNAVPIRMVLPLDSEVDAWLLTLRDHFYELLPNEHVALDVLHPLTQLAAHQALFESLVVVENQPSRPVSGSVQLVAPHSDISSMLPLALALLPGESWSAKVRYDTHRFDAAHIDALVAAFEQAIAGLATAATVRDGRARLTPPACTEPVSDRQSPTDAVELGITRVWEQVLGRTDIGIDDDFFAIGGSSILAVDLFAALEEQLGHALPLNTLLDAPTIRTLADRVRDGKVVRWTSLVPLQAGSTARRPLFCLHAGGGYVLYYRALTAHLDPDLPVYGLEPVGLDGKQPPIDDMEAMAAHYVQEVRSVQPAGPYRLLGYCFGCTVAIEMARQLEAAGETVELVVFVDSVPRPVNLRERLDVRVYDLRRRKLKGVVVGMWLDAQRRRQRNGSTQTRRIEAVTQACGRALQNYAVPRVAAGCVLIPSEKFDQEAQWRRRTLHWSRHVGGFEVVPAVPHKHEDILLEPAVQWVAQTVDERLRTLDGQP